MTSIKTNEKGLVSITVTVIIMLVITITVLSFAQIIRREQRQALDNQLSDQAFYAAESGINQTREYIYNTWVKNGDVPVDKTECGPNDDYPADQLPMSINDQTDTRFTCLLVGGSPKSLQYDLSPTAASKIFPIDTGTSGAVIKSLDISWTPASTGTLTSGCSNSPVAAGALPPASAWPCSGYGRYGMIRIDLVPAGDLSREGMLKGMFTAFLRPTDAASVSPVSYNGTGKNIYQGDANQGAQANASCDNSTCKVTINNMSGTKYYARVSTLYREATLSLTANGDNGPVSLTGAQVLIDATGRSQDVLRRIQVRVPLVGDGVHPDYGLQSTDSMCKQFKAYPPVGGDAGFAIVEC